MMSEKYSGSVRDLTKNPKEYKGHEITAGAGGKDCPCLPCWNIHDCGYYDSRGRRVSRWDCAERVNNGCPLVLRRPLHIFKNTKRFQKRKASDIFKCLRCGQGLKLGEPSFDFVCKEA